MYLQCCEISFEKTYFQISTGLISPGAMTSSRGSEATRPSPGTGYTGRADVGGALPYTWGGPQGHSGVGSIAAVGRA